ncbi:GNAT family protein [Kribbella sp.]|uniref:GNAT family N-acetyltransferase n=1 Tax=Kribbella sp. TaxID=1871183 RepID=UPI002D224BBC|nr:GNAT family protein [Kribbella sp.]HZX03311.1 GNAT family protein [Kribbella sp.]
MIAPRPLTPDVELRIASVDDAPALAAAQILSREHLRRWEPVRTEKWFTTEGQLERMNYQLERYKNGHVVPWVLASGSRIVGAITLSDLVPGPFRSASLGYWVSVDSIGQGLATRAVEAVASIADSELKLHRIEASTLTGNVASQRVLERTGFQQIGMAPTYLHIDGYWQDCNLYQKILNNREPGA